MSGFGPGRAARWVLTLFCLSAPAQAGQGAAELSLDRGAVKALLTAAAPAPLQVALPGLGPATVRLRPATHVDFSEGGIEAEFPLELVEAGFRTALAVRLIPEVDPLDGTLRLRPESVQPLLALPVKLDLSAWLSAFELPRRFDWPLTTRDDTAVGVICFLQGMTVEAERVVLQLGLSVRDQADRAGTGRERR